MLSSATTAALKARSAILNNDTPKSGDSVTFYRPYSDKETTELEMDRLGIQAAIGSATLGVGGEVVLPAGLGYRIDGPIIMPIFEPFGYDQPMISFGGEDRSRNAATLSVTKDFGPGSAAISCGDPTANSSNGRGLYEGETGYFCSGTLHDVRLKPGSYDFVYGLRPTWSTVPVAMDGIKQGPRLFWNNVYVSGFNNGALAVMDHTELRSSTLRNNFIGMRLDDKQGNLFGDQVFDRLYLTSNSWAGLSVSAKSYLSAEVLKPYWANNPYAIFCEPSFVLSQCVQGTTVLNANNENTGCGIIKDGGIRDGFKGDGGTRAINDTLVVNAFHGGRGEFGKNTTPVPAGGCTWAAYYDVGFANDFNIEGVWVNEYPPIANAFAHILRVRRLDGFSSFGNGGFKMSGRGVWTTVQSAQKFGQSVLQGRTDLALTFSLQAHGSL